MLTNKEYAQILTALFYASNGADVPFGAVNSLLRMHTDNPGDMVYDRDSKTLTIDNPKHRSFFSRLWPVGLFHK